MENDFAKKHLEIIGSLLAPSGLFLASAQNVSTGYNKSWLRDNFYTAMAFERAGEWDVVEGVWRAILDILLKHEHKINWAAENKPYESWQYIHARYNPETFEEYWEEWGNKQNDAVGAIMFKLGDLEEKGINIIKSEDDKRIVQRLVDYLKSLEYWHDPDSGIWEENEEIHASSVAACLAGLKKLSKLEYINVPVEIIEKGKLALKSLLPRESKNKFSDLALLSIIFPYGEADKKLEDEILINLEYHLEKKRGVIRYKSDRYYNKNNDGFSEEAEWTMGFPWLSIIYSRRGELEKAKYYFKKSEEVLTLKKEMPELYFSNDEKPNENTPLGWAQSLFVVAHYELEDAKKNNLKQD